MAESCCISRVSLNFRVWAKGREAGRPLLLFLNDGHVRLTCSGWGELLYPYYTFLNIEIAVGFLLTLDHTTPRLVWRALRWASCAPTVTSANSSHQEKETNRAALSWTNACKNLRKLLLAEMQITYFQTQSETLLWDTRKVVQTRCRSHPFPKSIGFLFL